MARTAVILRVIGAAAALVSGGAHVAAYRQGYRYIETLGHVGPLDIGEQFLLNALAALAIALGLVVPLFVRTSDLVWKVAALGAIAWAAISARCRFPRSPQRRRLVRLRRRAADEPEGEGDRRRRDHRADGDDLTPRAHLACQAGCRHRE